MAFAYRRALGCIAVAALGLAACEDEPPMAPERQLDVSADHLPGSSTKGSVLYTADLAPLNSSGVRGKARILVRANGADVKFSITARGVTPNQIHAQHVHGFLDGTQSLCPTLATDDVDGSGLVEVGEGVDGVGQDYGGILIPLDGSLDVFDGLGDLSTFPVGSNGGSINYGGTVSKADLAVGASGGFDDLSLNAHAVVIHGRFVDGTYSATLPVACGLLTQKNSS